MDNLPAVLYDECHLYVERLNQSPHRCKVAIHRFQVSSDDIRKLLHCLDLLGGQDRRLQVRDESRLLPIETGDDTLEATLAVSQCIHRKLARQVQIHESLKLSPILCQQIIHYCQAFPEGRVLLFMFLLYHEQALLQDLGVVKEALDPCPDSCINVVGAKAGQVTVADEGVPTVSSGASVVKVSSGAAVGSASHLEPTVATSHAPSHKIVVFALAVECGVPLIFLQTRLCAVPGFPRDDWGDLNAEL
jgi:hypothetical protein